MDIRFTEARYGGQAKGRNMSAEQLACRLRDRDQTKNENVGREKREACVPSWMALQKRRASMEINT